MLRKGKYLSTAVVAAVLAGAALAGAAFLRHSVFPEATQIEELRDLPLNSVAHLAGVVTYVDGPGHRLWIEDRTGTAVLSANLNQEAIDAGQTVTVDATKTGSYDPGRGQASLGLKAGRIHLSWARIKLPQPVAVSLSRFPLPEKNGSRVEVSGVVERAWADEFGRAWLTILGRGLALDLVVARPTRDYPALANATVRAVGISEQARDPRGGLLVQQVWALGEDAVQLEKPAPSADPLYTIRDLYTGEISSHRIGMRGTVAAMLPDSILLEDRWGAIECHLAQPQALHVGEAVEAIGFPNSDTLRFDLFQARAVEIPAQQVERPDRRDADLRPITTIAAVRELPPARAGTALPVRLSGTITRNDSIWRQLYLQDGTGGIFLKYSGPHPEFHPGLRVIATGVTGQGDFAPVVLAPKFHIEDRGPLPNPIPITAEKATADLLDSRYVTAEGVVHEMKFGEQPRHPVLFFILHTGIGEIQVFSAPGFPDPANTRLEDDGHVRVHGVFGTSWNVRRQVTGYRLLISNPSEIEIIEPAPRDPFAIAATPIASLLSFSPAARSGYRIKVSGTVTMSGPSFLYMQDQGGGLELLCDGRSAHVGERIDAIGYPSLVGRYSPVFTDAAFRPIGGDGAILPQATAAESIMKGEYESQLVAVDGRLINISSEPGLLHLALKSGMQTFSAELDTSDRGSVSKRLKEGSVLRLTGVASVEIDPNEIYSPHPGAPIGFKILLRSRDDLATIKAAPFWTARKDLGLLALFLLSIAVTLVRLEMLRRRVLLQESELRRAAQTAQQIRDLSSAIEEVSNEEKFHTEVVLQGGEEIARLQVGFNKMSALLLERDLAKHEAEARLQRQALFDDLTGLPNRRLFTDRLSQCMAAARRENRMTALLYIDLDGFKPINDSFGHAAGDLLLTEVSERLKLRIRESDTLARLGSDEFTILLSHVNSKADASKVAQELLDGLVRPFTIEGHQIAIGASIGISTYPEPGSENDDMLQQADSALYEAKKGGKNQVAHFSRDLGASVRERLILESELRQALVKEEIKVHYQPEFDIATNTIVRFEALARWTHPNLGAIPPLTFIPIAEESGLIFPLGKYMLEHAAREAVRWQQIAGRPVQVAVNVSSVEFARESFVEQVVKTLGEAGLSADLLQLEITESATLIGIDRTAATMRRLKDLGISIAMDDFGSGYSCLSYLPKLPFDALKIDRSFINQLVKSAESRSLVRSILSLAKGLGMKVIVEGIEDREQLDLIAQMGGDEAQGYLLGRPSPDPAGVLRLEHDAGRQNAAERSLLVG